MRLTRKIGLPKINEIVDNLNELIELNNKKTVRNK